MLNIQNKGRASHFLVRKLVQLQQMIHVTKFEVIQREKYTLIFVNEVSIYSVTILTIVISWQVFSSIEAVP